MKKLLAIALSLSVFACVSPALIRAADADTGATKRPKLTEEQRKLRKDLIDKYDTNKDGKLDKAERAKISKEDQDKMEKAGLNRRPKKSESGDKSDSTK